MVKAGLLGEPNGQPSRDPEIMRLFFENVKFGMDTRYADGIKVVQWDFADADPWHIVIDNGNTRAEQGRVEEADVTLKCRYEDWVNVVAGRADPRKSMLTGKIRPSGKLSAIWKSRRLFPG
jgi:hypothetical protein